MLPVDGMAISIVMEGSGNVYYEANHDIPLDGVSFAGTGSYAAAECWQQNRCAKRAVESAKTSDQYTGGPVRFVNVRSSENNLGADIDLKTLIEIFRGGSPMASIQTKAAVMVLPVTDLSANDEEVRVALEMARREGAAPTAPCDAVFAQWPQQEKDKLAEAMDALFS